jgi:hypothetical protein
VAQHKTVSKTGGKGRVPKRSTKKTRTSRPSRTRSSARGSAAPEAAGDEEVSIDRRRGDQRRSDKQPPRDQCTEPAPQLERRQKVNRRRQIDPTTCERDYSEDEVEFMNALDNYKRKSGRMFPTCSEVLEVVRDLGYVKLPPAEFESLRGAGQSVASAKPMPSDWPASAATGERELAGTPALESNAELAH